MSADAERDEADDVEGHKKNFRVAGGENADDEVEGHAASRKF